MSVAYIVLLSSDVHGNPMPGSSGLHYCIASDDPNVPIGNQMHAGGNLPDYDCGDECTATLLRWLGKPVPAMPIIEREENTTSSHGTYLQDLVTGLADNGVPAHLVNATVPPGMWWFNPAFAGICSPTAPQASLYVNAQRGWAVQIDTSPAVLASSTSGTAIGTLRRELMANGAWNPNCEPTRHEYHELFGGQADANGNHHVVHAWHSLDPTTGARSGYQYEDWGGVEYGDLDCAFTPDGRFFVGSCRGTSDTVWSKTYDRDKPVDMTSAAWNQETTLDFGPTPGE